MIRLAQEKVRAFEARMARQETPPAERAVWLKWVRYYLDFCQKHGLSPVPGQVDGKAALRDYAPQQK